MNKNYWVVFLASISCSVLTVSAAESINQENTEERSSIPVRYNFIGDNTRIGVGYDWDTKDVWGELFHVLSETDNNAWIAELWGKNNAGGAKLNYHWLPATDEKEAVNKVFFAFDQNEHEDQKLTAGYGRENEHWFWGLSVSGGISGERHESSSSISNINTIFGTDDGRPFQQLVTTTLTTDQFEKPYDYGVGLRAGHFYPRQLLRLRGGLDYEVGDYNSNRATISLGVEKYFANTPHSIALTASYSNIEGDFETDNHDAGVMLSYRYEFGKRYQVANRTERVVVEKETTIVTKQVEKKLIQTKVTLSEDAFFGLASFKTSPQVQAEIKQWVARIKGEGYEGNVKITGHTCDLGSDGLNQKLSENRAAAIGQLLSAAGIPANDLITEGKGEHNPKYPNDSEASRKKNRRVNIEYISYRDSWQENEVPGKPMTMVVSEWEEREIIEAPDWSRQALRNPVSHKRKVDYYKHEKTTETVSYGEIEYLNRPPEAVDTQFAVDRDSLDNLLDVLSSASDPDGDVLSVESVTQPAHGMVVLQDDTAVYTPVQGYVGADSFDYVIVDGNGGSDTATASIDVLQRNLAPVARNDSYSVESGIETSFDVLSNDMDVDGDVLVITEVSQPMHGSVTYNLDTIDYQSQAGFVGNDHFTYSISDGHGGTASATVNVTISPALPENLPPRANGFTLRTDMGMPIIFNVLSHASDPDNDVLTVSNVTDGEYGMSVLNLDQTVTYTPMMDFCGEDRLKYTVSDGRGGFATAIVVIIVGGGD